MLREILVLRYSACRKRPAAAAHPWNIQKYDLAAMHDMTISANDRTVTGTHDPLPVTGAIIRM